ncbi:MFS transporter [Streptomyces sp. NPDC127068]|uniref:MFS transporter n=1 Tax=Streptomyces sp. NPDC127068 TaxID=3347127 RepID=UPI003655B686
MNTRFAEGPARCSAACSPRPGAGSGYCSSSSRWPCSRPSRLPARSPPDARPAGACGSFDALGAVLATAGSSLLVLGLVSGPEAGWGSLRGAGSLVAGVLILAVFALVEKRTRSPLVPLRLFGNRRLVTAVLTILVFQSALGGSYYLFTHYLQSVLSYDALAAGLAFVPLAVVSMAASLKLAGVLLGRWGPRATLFTGMSVNGVGMIVLALAMSAHASFWALVSGLIVWGVGGGITFPAVFVCAATGVAPQEAGIASALASTSQQIGGAPGLALLVALATAGLSGDAGVASVLGGLLAFTLRGAAARNRSERRGT